MHQQHPSTQKQKFSGIDSGVLGMLQKKRPTDWRGTFLIYNQLKLYIIKMANHRPFHRRQKYQP